MATEQELQQLARQLKSFLGSEQQSALPVPSTPPTGAQAARSFMQRRAQQPAGVIPTLLSPSGAIEDIKELPGQITTGLRGLLGAAGRGAEQVRRESPLLAQIPGAAPLAGIGKAFLGQEPKQILTQTGSLSSAASGALTGAALGGPIGGIIGAALGPQVFDVALDSTLEFFKKENVGTSGVERAENIRRDVLAGLLTLGAAKSAQGAVKAGGRLRSTISPSQKTLALKEANAPGAAAARLGVPKGSGALQRKLVAEIDDALPVIEKKGILKNIKIDKSDPIGPQKFFKEVKARTRNISKEVIKERNSLIKEADRIDSARSGPLRSGVGAEDVDFSTFDKAVEKLGIGGTEATAEQIKVFADVRSQFLQNFEAAGKPLSLQELTGLQQNLFRELKQLKAFSPQASGGAFVDPAQAARIQARIQPVKELTKSIRNTINKKAKEILGEAKGSRIQELNTDFSNLKPFEDAIETLELRNQLLRSGEAAGIPERTTFPTNRTGALSRLGGGARTRAELLDAPGRSLQGLGLLLDAKAGRVSLPSQSLAQRQAFRGAAPTATIVSGQTRQSKEDRTQADRDRITKALALEG